MATPEVTQKPNGNGAAQHAPEPAAATPTADISTLNLHQRLARIIGELKPIAKEHRNDHFNYKYTGHDQIMQELSPLLAKYGVLLIQNIEKHEEQERGKTSSGRVIRLTRVWYRYDVINADCPPDHFSIPIIADALDDQDKGFNKASTAADKYLCFRLFRIATPDADPDAGGTDAKEERTRAQARNKASREVTSNMAPELCTRCGGAIINLTHKAKGKNPELIPWQRIREKAMAEFKRPVCGDCQLKVAHGEPLGEPLKPSEKAKPAAEANRGHGNEQLNKTHVAPFDDDPELVEIVGWLQSVKLVDKNPKKPFLALKFADGFELSSWHVGGGALAQLEQQGVGKSCTFIATVKQKGEKTYYNLDSIERLGEHDFTQSQEPPEPEYATPPADVFTGATDDDIPF